MALRGIRGDGIRDRELLDWGGGVNRTDGLGESRTLSFDQFQIQSQMRSDSE